VLNIVTVHWRDPKWIAPQLEYLSRHLSTPHRVFANLEGIEDPVWKDRFHYVDYGGGPHPDKLNQLAQVVAAESGPDDLLMFIDGDAFPVRPLDDWMAAMLAERPLAAVRRAENVGDIQPHPCFCITTVGLWQDVKGDWRTGNWVTEQGDTVGDVGGALLHILAEHDVPWTQILRSNRLNPHPLWYAVYGEHVYHHGAGFRPRVSRVDEQAGGPGSKEAADYLELRAKRRAEGWVASLRQFRPRHVRRLWRSMRLTLKDPTLQSFVKEADAESDRIYEQILRDPDFFRQFE
jgi:hypothetical protein